MRTSILMIALAGVFAISAAHAQTAAPAKAAGSTTAAPAKPKNLASSFGELIKAAAEQQKAQREAKTAEPDATQVALDAKPAPEAVHAADAVADTKTPSP